jgi:hypothetical protein
MGDVEAQAIRRDERALLRDVIAERHAQSFVQKMRRRVIGANAEASGVIDLQFERLADSELALFDDDVMDEEIAKLLACFGDAGA